MIHPRRVDSKMCIFTHCCLAAKEGGRRNDEQKKETSSGSYRWDGQGSLLPYPDHPSVFSGNYIIGLKQADEHRKKGGFCIHYWWIKRLTSCPTISTIPRWATKAGVGQTMADQEERCAEANKPLVKKQILDCP